MFEGGGLLVLGLEGGGDGGGCGQLEGDFEALCPVGECLLENASGEGLTELGPGGNLELGGGGGGQLNPCEGGDL